MCTKSAHQKGTVTVACSALRSDCVRVRASVCVVVVWARGNGSCVSVSRSTHTPLSHTQQLIAQNTHPHECPIPLWGRPAALMVCACHALPAGHGRAERIIFFLLGSCIVSARDLVQHAHVPVFSGAASPTPGHAQCSASSILSRRGGVSALEGGAVARGLACE